MTTLVAYYFPQVYDRYLASLFPETKSRFGIFDLFCINMPGKDLVKSLPHV